MIRRLIVINGGFRTDVGWTVILLSCVAMNGQGIQALKISCCKSPQATVSHLLRSSAVLPVPDWLLQYARHF